MSYQDSMSLVVSEHPQSLLSRASELPKLIALEDGRMFNICKWSAVVEAGQVLRIEMEAVVKLPTEDVNKALEEEKEAMRVKKEKFDREQAERMEDEGEEEGEEEGS